jgi:hypothetical protein
VLQEDEYLFRRPKMKMASYCSLVGIMAGALTVLAASYVVAETITIIGTVTEAYYLETDLGDQYEIGTSEKGDELLNYVGQKLQVKGTLIEEDEVKIIDVISFKLIENEG